MPTYNAGRYEMRPSNIARWPAQPGLDAESRDGFAVAEAACDLKLKRLTTAEAEALADTQRRERRAAALSADGAGPEPRRSGRAAAHCGARWRPAFRRARGWRRRCFPAATCICCGAIIRRRWSTTAIWRRTFPASKNAAAAHWRAGWLSYRQGLYADAARIFDEQIRLYPGADGDGVGALLARAALRDSRITSRPAPRPTTAPWFAPTSTFFMRRWRGSGWPRWAMTQPAAAAATGPHSGRAGAGAGRRAFPPTARTWPRRGCWPMRD